MLVFGGNADCFSFLGEVGGKINQQRDGIGRRCSKFEKCVKQSSRRVEERMNEWRQELHVVNMEEAPIFSMEDNNIPVLTEYVLSEYFLGVVRSSIKLPKTHSSFPYYNVLCGHQKAFLSLKS